MIIPAKKNLEIRFSSRYATDAKDLHLVNGLHTASFNCNNVCSIYYILVQSYIHT